MTEPQQTPSVPGSGAAANPPSAQDAPKGGQQAAPAGQGPASPAVEKTGDAGASDKAKTGETTTKSAAPDKYEFTFEQGRELSAEAVTQYSAFAKKLGLTQEVAQSVLGEVGSILEAEHTRKIQDAYGRQRQQWEEQLKADPQLGGAQYEANRAIAAKAIDRFGTPALRQLFDQSGFGSHPELFRWVLAVGKAISEDTAVSGAPRSPQPEASGMHGLAKAWFAPPK